MEGYCSTGQSPQRAVVPVEEEQEEDLYKYVLPNIVVTVKGHSINSLFQKNKKKKFSGGLYSSWHHM
jgi:hypothetical protein